MKRIAIAALLMVTLGVSGVVCQRVAARGRFAAPYSSYGAGPTGTRGLYTLLSELGVDVRRQSEDLATLPEGGMLVALGGCDAGMARKLGRYEQEELDRWIGSGGTLLLAGARDYLPTNFGIGFVADSSCTRGWRLRGDADDNDNSDNTDSDDESTSHDLDAPRKDSALEASDGSAPIVSVAPAETTTDAGVISNLEDSEDNSENYDSDENYDEAATWNGDDQVNDIAWTLPLSEPLLGLDLVPLKRPGMLITDAHTQHTPLLGVGDVVHATVMPRGRGRVIWMAAASPFQNGQLREAEGGVIFSRLVDAYAKQGPVLFDEYHLGVGEKRSLMGYLRRLGLLPFVAQLVLAMLIVLWRNGARFGGVQREVEPPPQGTASYVASMASLLQRVNDPRGAIQILLKQALRRVAQHHHVAVARDASDAAQLAAALNRAGHPEAAAESAEIVEAAARVDREGTVLCAAACQIDDATRRATESTQP